VFFIDGQSGADGAIGNSAATCRPLYDQLSDHKKYPTNLLLAILLTFVHGTWLK
jgi:hypothetical protein